MHASIRRYECVGTPITTDELVGLGREIAATLSHAPGFVSLLILSAAPEAPILNGPPQQVLAAVSIFEDQPGLEQAERLIAAPLEERLAAQCPARVAITHGEIVFQRGL
jgi:hypothetical protein